MLRRKSIRGVAVLATLEFALVPAAAVAEPGSNQYCDPFGGCGGTSGGQSGGGHSGNGGGAKEQPNPQQIARIIQVLQSNSLTQKQRAADLAGADAATIARYKDALQARQAAKVLEAAGLSALSITVSKG
jgi:hypothetical protein